MKPHDEVQAVRERYARRAGADPGVDPGTDRHSIFQPAVLAMLQERQRALLNLLARHGRTDLSALRGVEVGCGAGGNLLELLRWGFAPAHLQGLELLPERHQQARQLLPPQLALHLGDAVQAPVQPLSQDLVLQFTVFSSLLDDEFQQQLAQAMWRWLKPGGAIVWYDFCFDNPRNPDVRGVPLSRLRALFPHAPVRHRRVTLAPPLARAVCGLHPALYPVFNTLPLLRTHLLAWIEKPRA